MPHKDTLASPLSSEATNVPSESGKPIEKPQPPLLNRAQRRQLRRYINHKAALQARHVLAKRRRMAAKQAKIAKMLAKQAKYAAGIID